MKIALVLCAIVGLSYAAPHIQLLEESYSLQQDLQDILKLIPLDKMDVVVKKYVKSDKEVIEVVQYLQGKEWAALVAEVASKPEVKKFKEYLKAAGIDADALIKKIHDYIASLKPGQFEVEERGVREFVDEIKALLPLKDLLNVLNDKLANSKDFQEFYKKISSAESRKLVNEVLALPEVKRLIKRLEDMGLDIQSVLDLIAAFLGWTYDVTRSAFSLQQDLQDILKLIPLEKMDAVVKKYIKSDKEVIQVVQYLQGKEWAALVAEVAAKPEVKKFKEYLKAAGIDADALIKKIHDYIASLKPGQFEVEERGVREFVDEIKALLPLKDLLNVLNDKLANSKDFQEFYKKISSAESRKLVNEVLALPEVKRLIKRLEDMGLDIQSVLDLIAAFLGWTYDVTRSAFSLQQDLQDILKLIPLEKMDAVVKKYIKSDKEVIQVVQYLQGKEWAALVAEVAAKPEVKKFKEYLKAAGIDADALIKKIHDYIASLKPGQFEVEERGVREFVDEIKALLPLKDLLNVLNDKLANSKDFQEFYKKISSAESRKLVNEVLALPEVKRLIKRLEDMGLDIQSVLDLIAAFLGWTYDVTRSAFSLQQDLQDILKLIPLEKMDAVVKKYIKSDKEVIQVVQYLQGKEWAALVAQVAAKPEVKKFKEYLKAAGIDADALIKKIHDYIASLKPGQFEVEERGVREFVDEIKALLPLKDLLNVLNDKLANSKDFQEFYKKISSEESRKLVNEVLALAEVKRLIQRLEEMGLDIQSVLDLIAAFLGWN